MPNAVNVLWTLSYEMVFYLLITAMFVAGVHPLQRPGRTGVRRGRGDPRRGAAVRAAGLAVAGRDDSRRRAAAGRRPRRDAQRQARAAAGGCRGRGGARPDAARAQQPHRRHREPLHHRDDVRRDGRPRHPGGWLRRAPAMAMVSVVPALSLVAGMRTPTSWALYANPDPLGRDWSIAVAAAWLTFLAGLALRNRRMPRFLVWSGWSATPSTCCTRWSSSWSGTRPGRTPGACRSRPGGLGRGAHRGRPGVRGAHAPVRRTPGAAPRPPPDVPAPPGPGRRPATRAVLTAARR